ncbi:MAG TPA: hypothetical protein DCX92_00245 [Bacteroidetes bacterium]|nr:hypothetical protein [Bacteroidota bacterium]
MRSLKIIFFLAVIVMVSSCGKKDEKVNSENQSSTQNVAPNSQQNTNSGAVNKKWAGQYTFEESAKNVTGDGAQT